MRSRRRRKEEKLREEKENQHVSRFNYQLCYPLHFIEGSWIPKRESFLPIFSSYLAMMHHVQTNKSKELEPKSIEFMDPSII